MKEYNNRSEVPEEYKWDLSSFFKNEEEFNKTYEEAKKLIVELKNYVNCTKDINTLAEFMQKWILAIALYEDLYVYAHLINDQELGVSESIQRKNKTQNLGTEIEKNTSFFAPELLSLDEDYFAKIIKDDRLQEYVCELNRIYRNKEHILNENEEKIIAELVNSMDHFDDMSSTLLNCEHDYGKIKVDGETITLAPNNYRKLLKNKDAKIRSKVYKMFNKTLDQYGETSASLLNGYVSCNNTLSKIRHFKSSWDEKLFDLNLSDKCFRTLVSTTEKNLDVLQKYYELKKEELNLETLHPYDLSLSMVKNERKYTIPEAQKIVSEAIKPLGEEYSKRFAKIINNRYIDYCQYKGKCSGGYSFATMRQDSRILMSYNYDLDSVSTIAHEGGHNVHHQILNENNPYQYRDTSSLVAEVCSLINECLLSDYIYNTGKNKEEKLSGLANIMGVIVSNLFGAVREGKIEEDMYKEVLNGGAITKDFMNNLVKKSLKKYYGKTVRLDKFAVNSWMQRSHYYMHFYLYNYSFCISIATYVASEILKGNKNMLNNYLEFMKVGSDKWPTEAFQVLGINLEDETVYQNAINYFDELINKYRDLSHKEGVANE